MAIGRKTIRIDERAPLLQASGVQVTIGKKRILVGSGFTST